MITRTANIGGIDTRTPVLVLGVKTHGSLGILRSLGRLGIPVYGVASDPRGPASYSKYLRGRFVFDLASAAPEAAVEYLLEVGKNIGSRAVLIPTEDETSLLVSDSDETLNERFLLPHQPGRLAHSLSSKREMHFLARQHSIPTPEVVFPSGIEEVRTFAAGATFPVMLKGIDGNRLKLRTGTKMVIVKRPDELVRRYLQMEDPTDPNLMLQEYIPGGDDAVWMFNGYFDRESDCLAGFTGRKLRQYPVYIGATSLGICAKNEVVEQTTLRWMKQLGYRGILDIGYRYDARDGQYKVLDVNPRIGSTFRLFVAKNDIDVARALYLDMTGQPVPVAELSAGRKWMVETDLASCLQYRRDGRLTLRQWAASLRGVEETGYFARDDLAPFLRLPLYAIRRGSYGKVGLKTQPVAERQDQVNRHFASTASTWKMTYEENTLSAVIYQERSAAAFDWIDGLAFRAGTPVLEVGCGAGLSTVALAQRGFTVTAIDSVPAMIQLTNELATDRNVAGRVRASVADVHNLPFSDCSFSLVVALGVLPWLHSPDRALDEIARVLRPGGFLLATVDNSLRLNNWLDPRLNPALSPPRRFLGDWLRRLGIMGKDREPTLVRMDSPGRFDNAVTRTGLEMVRRTTIGFGPFTFWNRRILSDPTGMQLHRKLQDLADRGIRLVDSLGAHYVVLARRPTTFSARD